jgi:hypothetical protein
MIKIIFRYAQNAGFCIKYFKIFTWGMSPNLPQQESKFFFTFPWVSDLQNNSSCPWMCGHRGSTIVSLYCLSFTSTWVHPQVFGGVCVKLDVSRLDTNVPAVNIKEACNCFTLFLINFLTNLSIRASAILILLARNCKLLARILKCHICM